MWVDIRVIRRTGLPQTNKCTHIVPVQPIPTVLWGITVQAPLMWRTVQLGFSKKYTHQMKIWVFQAQHWFYAGISHLSHMSGQQTCRACSSGWTPETPLQIRGMQNLPISFLLAGDGRPWWIPLLAWKLCWVLPRNKVDHQYSICWYLSNLIDRKIINDQ